MIITAAPPTSSSSSRILRNIAAAEIAVGVVVSNSHPVTT